MYGGCESMASAVLFDLYSTLVEESPESQFYRKLAALLNIDYHRWYLAYRRAGSLSMSGVLPGMVDRVWAACVEVGPTCDHDAATAAVKQALPLFYDSISVDRDARSTLIRLREEGYRLALVSNASYYSIQVLETTGLTGYFDAVTLSCHFGVLKPSPGLYTKATSSLGVEPGQCVFVGDGGDNELRGARNLGMRAVLIDRNLPHTPAARQDADRVIDRVSGVLDCLAPARERNRT